MLLFQIELTAEGTPGEPAGVAHSKRYTGFLENKGQCMDESGKPAPYVLFECRAPGTDVFITTSGITTVFFEVKEEKREDEKENGDERKTIEAERIDLVLVGASIKRERIKKEKVLQGDFNYFYGHCPEGIYGAKKWEKVTFSEVYPGIDWVIYRKQDQGFKYDFVVHPGADPSVIRMRYITSHPIVLDSTGSLQIKHHFGTLSEAAPVSFLLESRQDVGSSFRLLSVKRKKGVYVTELSFQLQDYDQRSTLIIDPQLTWSTFFGDNGFEGLHAMDTDSAGNVFMTGYFHAGNFPLFNAGTYYQTMLNVYDMVFITKFSNSGILLWSTLYGGSMGSVQQGLSLDVDRFGQLFVTGNTNCSDFPAWSSNSYLQSYGGNGDAFILKFTNTGVRLWAAFYGGSSYENGLQITTDPAGNVYMHGYTWSPNFPVQNGGGYYVSSLPTQTNLSCGFITKFTNTGVRLWATYMHNFYGAMACDNSGNLILTGASSGSLSLVNPGGGAYYQGVYGGGQTDAVIAKFTPATTLVWLTYYGGSGADAGGSIATDAWGNIFIGGSSTSTNMPLYNAGTYFQPNNNPWGSAILVKFNSSGQLSWGTCYYNGNAGFSISGDDLSVDTCGNLYVFGDSYAQTSNLPLVPGCNGNFQKQIAGNGEFYLMRFSNAGDLYWATYFGGSGNDFRGSIAHDRNGDFFVGGEWTGGTSLNYPLVNPGGSAYFQNASGGGDDSFISKFHVDQTLQPANYFVYPYPICRNSIPGGIVTPTLVTSGGTFTSDPGLDIHPITGVISLSTSTSGTHVVTYSAFSCGCYSNVAVTDTIDIGDPFTVSANSATACAGATVTLVAGTNPAMSAQYIWSIPGTGQQSLVTSAGTTSVFVVNVSSNAGCKASASGTLSIHPLPVLAITGDSFACEGNTVILSVTGASTYTWSTGAAGSSVPVKVSMNMVIEVVGTDNKGCVGHDSVLLKTKPFPTLLVSGDTICEGSTALLTVRSPDEATLYTWLSSSTTGSLLQIKAPQPGYYVVEGNLNGCRTRDSARVWTLPVVSPAVLFSYLGPVCQTDPKDIFPSLALNFPEGGTFSGAPGLTIDKTTGQIRPAMSDPGEITVYYTVPATGCTLEASGSATLLIEPGIPLNLEAKKRIAPGENAVIEVGAADSYQWIPADWLDCSTCAKVTATPPFTTRYCVTAIKGSCTATSCIHVEVACRGEDELEVPNAFSPNDDGSNDLFCIKGWQSCLIEFQFTVYDRWGQTVFISQDARACWDGTYKGDRLETGVFVYVLKARFTGDLTVDRKGNITLLR